MQLAVCSVEHERSSVAEETLQLSHILALMHVVGQQPCGLTSYFPQARSVESATSLSTLTSAFKSVGVDVNAVSHSSTCEGTSDFWNSSASGDGRLIRRRGDNICQMGGRPIPRTRRGRRRPRTLYDRLFLEGKMSWEAERLISGLMFLDP